MTFILKNQLPFRVLMLQATRNRHTQTSIVFPFRCLCSSQCFRAILADPLCSLPRAARTNYHRRGGLKQQIYFHTVLEATSPKRGCWQGWFFQEALRESLFQASLLAFDACPHPWRFPGCQSLPPSSQGLLFRRLCLSHLPLPFFYKDTYHQI